LRQNGSLQLVADDQPRQQLLATMALVGTARQQAARRLRTRLLADRIAACCLMAALVAVVASQLLYDSALEPRQQRDLALLGLTIAASLLIMICGGAKKRAAAIGELEICANEIALLRAALGGGPKGDVASVVDVRRRYHSVLRRCRENHRHADYLAASLLLGRDGCSRVRARIHFAAHVFLKNAMLLLAPVLLLAVR
jgi:hypothetical protein